MVSWMVGDSWVGLMNDWLVGWMVSLMFGWVVGLFDGWLLHSSTVCSLVVKQVLRGSEQSAALRWTGFLF